MNKKNGILELAEGAETAAVVFPEAFTDVPTYAKAELIAPADGFTIDWTIEGTPTAAGFTVRFAAPIPASGYSLSWFAIR